MHCNLYNERKIMIIFCLLFLTKDNTPRYGHSKKFRWLSFFSDANVFLVFLIIHVHAYNYEKLSIFALFTGNDDSCTCWIFYSHNLIKLTNLDECHGYSTSKNSNNFIFSLVFFYYWLSLNLKLIQQISWDLQCLMTKKKIYFCVSCLVYENNNLKKY